MRGDAGNFMFRKRLGLAAAGRFTWNMLRFTRLTKTKKVENVDHLVALRRR